MEYTFDDIYKAEQDATYAAYKRCLAIIDRILPQEPYDDKEKATWEQETRTLRALRGDIAKLYYDADCSVLNTKHKKELAEKDDVIERLCAKLDALETRGK